MSVLVRRRRITAASPTPEKLATFLRHLEESGSVSFAAESTGIGRNTVYELRKVDPAFARGWEKAVAMAIESLRDIAVVRARDGTERALWRRGRRVGVIREYDNRLLQFLLRALRPEVYGQSGAGADGSEQSEQLEHEQNRRRVGVLFDVPERPGLWMIFQRPFLKKRDLV